MRDKKDDRFDTIYEFQEALKVSLGTSGKSKGDSIDLADGECQHCQARNPTDRKFCRGCGEALRIKCLICDCENPIWEAFCADCGGNRDELLKERLVTLEKMSEQAESLRRDYKFAESLAIAKEIADLGTGRFKQFREWADNFTAETEKELNRYQLIASNKYAESKTHRKEYDYASAIKSIESLPESIRSPEISSYLKKLKEDFANSTTLIKVIADKVQRRDIDDLLPLVEDALKLRGDRVDLKKLRHHLHQRVLKKKELQGVSQAPVIDLGSSPVSAKGEATKPVFDKKKGVLVASLVGGVALLVVAVAGMYFLSLTWQADPADPATQSNEVNPFSAAEDLGEIPVPEVFPPDPDIDSDTEVDPFAAQSPD